MVSARAHLLGRPSNVKDINQEGPELGWTCLHLASVMGNVEMVQKLLAHPGIDVNHKNKFKNSALLLACCHGQAGVVRLLLQDSRVNVNDRDDDGCTPLWHAARNGHVDVIRWMIVSLREVDFTFPGGICEAFEGKPGEMKVVKLSPFTPFEAAKRYGEMHTRRLLEEWGSLGTEESLRKCRLALGIKGIIRQPQTLLFSPDLSTPPRRPAHVAELIDSPLLL